MSQHKLLLPSSEPRKNYPTFWLIGSIAFLAMAIIIAICAFSDKDEILTESKPLDNNTLALQEWDEYAELIRQTMDIDSVPQPLKQDEKINEDPFLIKGKIKRNQTLFVALKTHQLDVSDKHQVIDAMQKVVDFKKTKPGDRYEIHLDVDRRIQKFVYEISPISRIFFIHSHQIRKD